MRAKNILKNTLMKVLLTFLLFVTQTIYAYASTNIRLPSLHRQHDTDKSRDGEYVSINRQLLNHGETVVDTDGAPYIEVVFSDVDLGDSALTVLGADRKVKYGPYYADDIAPNGKLFTPL